jgi:hypothetical protein
MNVAQGELGEAREDASGWDGDAEAAEVEGDGGGVLEAWEVKGAFLPVIFCVILLRYQIGEVRLPERRHAAAGSHATTDSAAASSAAKSRRVSTASWAARAEAMAWGPEDAAKRSSESSVQRRRQQQVRTLVGPVVAASSRWRRMQSSTSLGRVLRRSTSPVPSSGLVVSSPQPLSLCSIGRRSLKINRLAGHSSSRVNSIC